MMVIRHLTIMLLFVFIAIATIGGCGGGGDGGDGKAANPLFNGTFEGIATTTQGGETFALFLTLTLFVESPLSGVISLDGEEFSISGDAVGNFATFTGNLNAECPGTFSGTAELIPDNTILFVSEGSDCNGPFSSTATLVREGTTACQSPPLNIDFSSIAVIFIDTVNSTLIIMSSDGEVVGIVLADIPDSGVLLALEGNVLSSTVCDIILSQFIEDGILFPILGATGQCRLENNFTVFAIEDLSVLGIPLGVDLRGECDEIVSLDETVSSGARSESLNSLNKAMLDKLQQMTDRQITKEEKGLILDFHEDIIQNQEE
ncbi:MAG: hypothetical protein V3U58_00675 [Thermodesulfobacteriota bacterium]